MAALSALNTVSLMGYQIGFPQWMIIGILAFACFSVSGYLARLITEAFKRKMED